MPKRNHLNTGLRSDEGASAVEFALVSMVLILFLAGIIQFGFTFFQYLEVVHSAREGARWASIIPAEGVGSVDDEGSVKYYVYEAAPGLNPRLADDDITVKVDGAVVTDITSSDSGFPVEVTVTYHSDIIIPPMNMFFGEDGVVLTSSATLKVE